MEHKNPLVSAIVPAFNAERYVGEAIDSILAQSYPNIEILVVDNASTDNTAAIIKRYGERVTYLHQAKKGPAAARNQGLMQSRGDFIAFLDADDLWLPEKTERQIRYLVDHPEVGVCYSHYEFIDSESRPHPFKARPQMLNGWAFEALLKLQLHVGIGTTMIRRSCIDDVGMLDENLITAEDTNFFIRLAKNYQFGYLRGPVARYRIHQDSLTKTDGVRRGTFKSLDYLVDRYSELHPSRSSLMAEAYAVRHLARGKRGFYRGDYADARQHARKAIKYKPSLGSAWFYLALSSLPPALVNLFRRSKR